jgi:hypothetical protein
MVVKISGVELTERTVLIDISRDKLIELVLEASIRQFAL